MAVSLHSAVQRCTYASALVLLGTPRRLEVSFGAEHWYSYVTFGVQSSALSLCESTVYAKALPYKCRLSSALERKAGFMLAGSLMVFSDTWALEVLNNFWKWGLCLEKCTHSLGLGQFYLQEIKQLKRVIRKTSWLDMCYLKAFKFR